MGGVGKESSCHSIYGGSLSYKRGHFHFIQPINSSVHCCCSAKSLLAGAVNDICIQTLISYHHNIIPSNHKIKGALKIFDDNNMDHDDSVYEEKSHGNVDNNDMDVDTVCEVGSHGNYDNSNLDEEAVNSNLDEEAAAMDDSDTGGSLDYARWPEISELEDDQNADRSESEKLFIKKYQILGKIGQGTYGKVYRGKERETGKYVAIKTSHIENPHEEGISVSTLREIANLKILNRSKDQNIVELLSVECVQKKNAVGGCVVYLVFEYMDCDLVQIYHDHQRLGQPMAPITIKSYMYQLLQGLEHSHKNGILHRDLKPSNLLVNETTGQLKIADWGLGRVVFGPTSNFSNMHGTLWYTSPEQLLGDTQHTFAVDMWAVGCIFGEMHSLKLMFEGNSEIDVLLAIFKKLGTPNESVWEGLSKLENWSDQFPQWRQSNRLRESLPNIDDRGFDLLSKMLDYQPSKRITAKHALSHSYFAEYFDSYESENSETDS